MDHRAKARLRFSGGIEHELDPKAPTTIGSGAEATLRLEDGQVSEVHCVVRALKDGGYAIKDLGSEVGTFVDGRRVDAARLQDKARVRVGATEFEFSDKAEAPPRAAPERSGARPAERSGDRSAERGSDQAVELAPGTRLGGYEIEGVLGRGGMGTVYRATQLSLGRKVAIKVLAKKLAEDPNFVARFESEARAAGRFNHPNVVQVFDVDEDAGRPFYSMELLPGGSLEDRLGREGPLPVDDLVRALRDASLGLAYADELGLVHRDIKPDNLMPDAQGTLKICDLGLATDLDQEGEGKILGTPHFLSPEQAKNQAVGHRSDIYSLGCSAYRLLTGKNPFPKATVRDILRAHVNEEAPSVRAERSDCPDAVDALIRRMMAKDPAERPHAREVTAELDAMYAGSPASRAPLFAVVAVALVAIAGVAWWFTSGNKEPITIVKTDPDAERVRFENRENEAEIARLQVREELGLLERAAAYDKVASDHAGTKAAEVAKRDAQALRERHAREEEERAENAAALAKRIEGVERIVSGADQDPVAAWQSLMALAGAANPGSPFAKAIDAAKDQVQDRFRARAQAAYERFESSARTAGSDLTALLTQLEEDLRLPSDGAPPSVAPFHEERLGAARDVVASLRKERREARSARVGELAKLRDEALFGEKGALALVREGKLDAARASLVAIEKAPEELSDLDAPRLQLVDLIDGAKTALQALAAKMAAAPVKATLRGAAVEIRRVEGVLAVCVLPDGSEAKHVLTDEAELVVHLLRAVGADQAFAQRPLPADARAQACLVVLFALAEALPEARAYIARSGDGKGAAPSFPWLYRDALARLATPAAASPASPANTTDAVLEEALALDALASMVQALRDQAEVAATHWATLLERRAAASIVAAALGIDSAN